MAQVSTAEFADMVRRALSHSSALWEEWPGWPFRFLGDDRVVRMMTENQSDKVEVTLANGRSLVLVVLEPEAAAMLPV